MRKSRILIRDQRSPQQKVPGLTFVNDKDCEHLASQRSLTSWKKTQPSCALDYKGVTQLEVFKTDNDVYTHGIKTK